MAALGSPVTFAPPRRVAWPWRIDDVSASSFGSSLPRIHAQCTASFVPHGRRVGHGHFQVEIDCHDRCLVSLVHADSHVVDRVFRFSTPVLDAVLTEFPRCQRDRRRRRDVRDSMVVCILSRADCISVFGLSGESYEVPLPFNANRIVAMPPTLGGGLLLQRRPLTSAPSAVDTAAAFSPSNAQSPPGTTRPTPSPPSPLRPRYFTLAHPLEEVKPIALSSSPIPLSQRSAAFVRHQQQHKTLSFLSDRALELVGLCAFSGAEETLNNRDGGEDTSAQRALMVCFHHTERRFVVYDMTRHVPSASADDTREDRRSSTGPVALSPSPSFVSPAKARQHQREAAAMEQYLKSHIIPEYAVRLVWTTPSLDMLNDNGATEVSHDSPVLRAFLITAEDEDEEDSGFSTGGEITHTLCIVHEHFGVLLLKPMHVAPSGDDDAELFQDREDNLHVIRCQSASPLLLDDSPSGRGDYFGAATDMIISAIDSARLFLYSAGRVVAEVVVPGLGVCSDQSVRLCASDWIESFTVKMAARDGRAELRRYKHPLRTEGSSLVRSVLAVLRYAISINSYTKLHIATLALAMTRYYSSTSPLRIEHEEDVEWWAFRSVVRSTVRRSVGWLSDESHEHGAPKKARATLQGEQSEQDDEDLINTILRSNFAATYEVQHSAVLAVIGDDPVIVSSRRPPPKQDDELAVFTGVELSTDSVGRMITALHLLHEDLRLSDAHGSARVSIARLLHEVCAIAGLYQMVSYYSCQYSRLLGTDDVTKKSPYPGQVNIPLFFDEAGVPDLYLWLREKLQGCSSNSHSFGGGSFEPVTTQVTSPPFPRLQGVYDWKRVYQQTDHSYPLWRTDAVCRVYELLIPVDDDDDDMQGKQNYDVSRLTELMEFLTTDPIGNRLSIDDLPIGIRFVLLEAIRIYREDPPHDVNERVCEFIGRRDLTGKYNSVEDEVRSATASASSLVDKSHPRAGMQKPNTDDELSTTAREVPDGLSEVVLKSQRLYPLDQRLKEVARLLRSNRPVCLRLDTTSDMTDHDVDAQRQARLLLLCKRSMALSVARGMVTLGTFDMTTIENQAWQLSVPALPLAGRTPPTNATVLLDVSAYAKELTHWPQFHNGCATGLRLPGRGLTRIITRYWIRYHRPSASDFQRPMMSGVHARGSRQTSTATARDIDEANAAHAGVLLGLGLNGHLKCLSMADMFNYLLLSNDYVRVAILLGMATTVGRGRRKRTSLSSAALQAARRRRRRERFAGTAPDPLTQDNVQLVTASQVAAPAVDMEINVPVSATQEQPPADDASTKNPYLNGAEAELSLERSVSKMLCLHIPAQLPPAYPEFTVSASTQMAALLGLGILYQGSGNRHMAELLLTEIARSPASPQFFSSQHSTSSTPTASPSTQLDQHEGYSLAAGLGLGLVLLGRGGATAGDPGLADLGLEEKLYKYIVGGATQPFPVGGVDGNASGSYLYRGRKWKPFGSGVASGVRPNTNGSSRNEDSAKQANDRGSWRGEHVNIGVTACGSALALAFMYIKSGNRSIGSQLAVPDTLILLDYVRPDILLIRVLAKNIVLWNSIEPTTTWIEKIEVPQQLREAYRLLQGHDGETDAVSMLPDHADVRSICESYANIVAGACLSMGLRFAGTCDSSARDTLRQYVVHFRDMRHRSALLGSDVIAAATDRVTIERCLSVCAQALALVDAGTGNLETFTLLRSINLRQRADNELTYGNHMALSMAIGLLFLGGGRATISRSNDAITALVVSLYPVGAMNTADNKYYLQAFRHLYTLAVDNSRHVETIDTASGESCSVELQVESHQETVNGSIQKITSTFKTPCLLPELDTIDRIVINTADFYPVDIHLQDQGDEDGDLDQWGGGRSAYASTSARTTANDHRVKLLLEKSRILLKRRAASPQTGMTILSLLKESTKTDNASDENLQAYEQYFGNSMLHQHSQTQLGDDGASAWWQHRLTGKQVPLGISPQSLLPTHLSMLFEVFSMRHPRRRLDSLDGLWNLKLIHEFHRISPFRSLERHPSPRSPLDTYANPASNDADGAKRDFIEWLLSQTEEALRYRWRHEASLSFPSLSAVQQGLVEYNDNTSPALHSSHLLSPQLMTETDSLLLSAFFVFFDAPPSVYQDPSDWRRRIQRAMTVASSSTQSMSSNAAVSTFAFDRFLQVHAHEDHVTKEEQTFWLRVVSCFLFSV